VSLAFVLEKVHAQDNNGYQNRRPQKNQKCAARLRRPIKRQKRATTGAKETYYMPTVESGPFPSRMTGCLQSNEEEDTCVTHLRTFPIPYDWMPSVK
jgi:hypothetical protein